MKKRNIVLVLLMLSSVLMMLCACAGGKNDSVNVNANVEANEVRVIVNSGRPSNEEALLDVCVNELFFERKINKVKDYVPAFESSEAEKQYWENMEDVLQLLNDYGIEFYSYEIEDVYVQESDWLQAYDFAPPFVDYTVDTAVTYEIYLAGDINVDKMNKSVDGYQEICEVIAEEGGLPQTHFLDVAVARRDGVWYFCTGDNEIENWMMQFEW